MWDVETTDTFDAWFELQSRALKEDMLATMLILSEFGPQLGLPIRAFFAFDPLRKAIVLCAGNKDGMNEKRFYKEMITLADREFSQHLTKER
ncbi:TPA: type II toxin-antitoxin system RelE/ParE family toxin [Klebsiella variicola subsp. variicola]